MTEADWLSCSSPEPMLPFLRDRGASDRKLRLFACGCYRRIRELMPAPRCWAAVEMAEMYADGKAHEFEVQLARQETIAVRAAAQVAYEAEVNESTCAAAAEVIARGWQLLVPVDAAAAAQSTLTRPAATAALQAGQWASSTQEWAVQAARWAAGEGRGRENDRTHAEEPHQALLLRDIFGNPFRHFPFDPSWRTDAVLALATRQYGSRDFSPMSVLADALQDAGCENAELLNHCRTPRVHVRGCYVIDLLLNYA